MRYPHVLKYLHEKPLPRLPLWNPGNPRPQLFLPQYWLKIVKPTHRMPNDFVKFECHWQMSVNDVREYLYKLYGIDVLDVRVEIKKGEYPTNPRGQSGLAPPLDDRKFVYVQLKEGTFEFPTAIAEQSVEEKIQEQQKAMNSMRNKERNKNIQRLDLGGWFQ